MRIKLVHLPSPCGRQDCCASPWLCARYVPVSEDGAVGWRVWLGAVALIGYTVLFNLLVVVAQTKLNRASPTLLVFSLHAHRACLDETQYEVVPRFHVALLDDLVTPQTSKCGSMCSPALQLGVDPE